MWVTVNHADVGISPNQLSVDGSVNQLKLQVIWIRVHIAHRQQLASWTQSTGDKQRKLAVMYLLRESSNFKRLQVLWPRCLLTCFSSTDTLTNVSAGLVFPFSLTEGSLSPQFDFQQRVQDLKDWRLLVIGQQQDDKVQLRSGVFAVRD